MDHLQVDLHYTGEIFLIWLCFLIFLTEFEQFQLLCYLIKVIEFMYAVKGRVG